MNWLLVVGLAALLALVMSAVVLVLRLSSQRRIEPLPDGDYVVTITEIRETPQGLETVFRVNEPKEFEGRTVTVVKEKGK